jgi:hypothetical protein
VVATQSGERRVRQLLSLGFVALGEGPPPAEMSLPGDPPPVGLISWLNSR